MLRDPSQGGGGTRGFISYYFMVKPIYPLLDKVFERPGWYQVKSFCEKISSRVRRYSLFEIYNPIYAKYLWEWLDEEICILGKVWISRIWDFVAPKNEIWAEMGPYGSVGAHIKTGRSPMAQDHVQTPPDPKKGHKNQKMIQKDVKAARSATLNL